jgi:tetratricopeptide (TPR) repeat protein
VFVDRGIVYRKTNRIDLAIKDYEQAIRLDPNNVAAYVDRGGAYYYRRDWDKAIQDYDRAIQLDPSEAKAFAGRGIMRGKKYEFDLAIKDFDQAIRLSPDNVPALNNRCWARAGAGKELDLALADCNAAFARVPAPASPASYMFGSRGLVYFRQGQFGKSIADLDAALMADPKSASALYVRGLAKRRVGDATGSRADILAAKAIEPDIADTYARIGMTP